MILGKYKKVTLETFFRRVFEPGGPFPCRKFWQAVQCTHPYQPRWPKATGPPQELDGRGV
jgi:hypothetical protein